MKPLPRRAVLMSSLLTAAGLAACASPDPVLFTLAPVPGAPVPGAPRSVVLREIGLARYLDRPQIVRATEDYQLDVAQNDWWGEPLGRMIGRILIADLAARLPASLIVAESGALSAQQADATVEVNILAFATDRAGAVQLSAQIAVIHRTPKPDRRSRALDLSEPVARPDVKSQVAAMSIALGRLADAVAEMLRR